MPILKGTMGYTRFLVQCPQLLAAQQIADKLNMFRFRALHPKGEDKESLGWCPYLSEYDGEKSIDINDFQFDKNLVLSMRIDSISLPKGLLRALVKQALVTYAKEHKKIPDRTTKKEIELAETLSLRSRVLPKTKIVEALWCQTTHELRIFSRSGTQLDHFLDLFQNTFLIRPERLDFAYSAWRVANIKNLESEFNQISHQPLFIPPIRLDVQ